MEVIAKVIGRRAFFVGLTEEQIQQGFTALSIKVPGAEYAPSFKAKTWDGYHRHFDWHHKACAVGLIPTLERKTGWTVVILNNDGDKQKYSIEGFAPKNGKGELLTPTDYQNRSYTNLLRNNGGMVSLATNAGKTLVISAISYAYAKAGKSVLILEGMVNLANQIQKEVAANTGMEVGLYSSGHKKIKGSITVVMVKTLAGELQEETGIADELANIDAVIVDECHHALAATYMTVIKACAIADRYAMSGTIKGDNTPEGLSLREVFGDVVETVTNDELVKRGISAKPKVVMIEYNQEPDFDDKVAFIKKEAMKTSFKYKTNPITKETERYFSPGVYTAMVKKFIMNYAVKHSALFFHIVKTLKESHKGKSIVVITDWRDQAESLAEHIDAQVFHGQSKNRSKILEDFAAGTIETLVVTQVLDEGISIDRIGVIILASTGYSSRQLLQRLGRGLRNKRTGENVLYLYDFIRYGHSYLINPSKERYKIWKGEGFEPELVEWEDYEKQKATN